MNATRSRSVPARIQARRWLLATLVFTSTAIAGAYMADMLWANGVSILEWGTLVLFIALFAWVSLAFWTVSFGFLRSLRKRPPSLTSILHGEGRGSLAGVRTAVVQPVYNEDPARVLAGLRATYESLRRTGHLHHFDFFVLSDTNDPDVWIREEKEFAALRAAVANPERFFYRKRRDNVERKSGNIREFCEEHGSTYRYMIVFDADSVMSGSSLVSLVRLMEQHPDVGIIQAPPTPVNRRTLFGRLQQFAARAYGPFLMAGLDTWQGGEGNYWGHNAILRVRPFLEHCELPRLPGREPLGGSILSHDFVEAALMRRAGWKVCLADVGGSYEEPPPTLVDFAARDRRWCQGNLQHARLLAMPGLNPVSRLHLLMGVMSYVASPLWILSLVVASFEMLRERMMGHEYFPTGDSPFPVWEISVVEQAILLFVSVMGMLFLPKLLSLVVHLRNTETRRAFGGGLRLTASVLLESLFSVLLAPVMAFLQSRFVASILLFGRNVKWLPQNRSDAGTRLDEAVRRHGGTTLLGVVWAVATWFVLPDLFWWISPVLLGLVLSIPLSVWSSRVDVGQWTRRRGLFLTPEESKPPEVLSRLRRLHAEMENGNGSSRDGLEEVLTNPTTLRTHLSLLPPDAPKSVLEVHRLEGLRLKLGLEGLAALSTEEKRDLLFDRDSLRILTDGESLPERIDDPALRLYAS